MSKRKKHDDHVNMERWLISYADFVTLMFVLFIILFAFSQIDIEKYKSLASSLKNEFAPPAQELTSGGSSILQYPGQGESQDMSKSEEEPKTAEQIEEESMARIAEVITAYAKEKGIENFISLRFSDDGLHLSITGTVLFDDASAKLTPQAKEFIMVIFGNLKDLPNHILIEGHTDKRPIKTAEFPTNWELSSARSINVIRYLIEEYKFDPQRLSSAAYSEYRPVAPNDSIENMSKNRRVEIIILKSANN